MDILEECDSSIVAYPPGGDRRSQGAGGAPFIRHA
jgi:hypothetical protein